MNAAPRNPASPGNLRTPRNAAANRSRSPADAGAGMLTVLAFARRDKARSLVRNAFTRRRAHLSMLRTATDLETRMLHDLVDAVIIDAGAGEDAMRLVAGADAFSSIPYFLVSTFLPSDAPMLARAVELGVTDILVEGVDEAVARELVSERAFSTRFERALSVPPPMLRLTSELQLSVWRSLIRRAGRPVRTALLAKELGVSREHLSRSFTSNGAPTLKKVIDLVRVLAAAELSKNSGYDVRDVAQVLGFASSSHLSSTTARLVGAGASSLSRLRATDLLQRFERLVLPAGPGAGPANLPSTHAL